MNVLDHLCPIVPLLLMGCGDEPMRTIGCLQSGNQLVLVDRNDPSALDGYNYRVCTTSVSSPKCGKYNRITIERPASLQVALTGKVAKVTQRGGSVFDYATDPAGMRDADFTTAMPLELTFTSAQPANGAMPVYQIGGEQVQLNRCPKS